MNATFAPAPERSAGSASPFGSLLRRYRLAAGLSQAALAERAGLSANGIGALERGYRLTPHRDTFALLADALGLDAEQRSAFDPARNRPDGPTLAGSAAPHDLASSAATSLIGRTTELGDLVALARRHRLVTVTGAGGIGKTVTAAEVVHRMAEPPEPAMTTIELAPVRDAPSIVVAIARGLGMPQLNAPRLEAVIAHLNSDPARSTRPSLLFDNCEHVVADAAAIVSALLRACPRVRILATSREPLKVAAEVTYRLPALGLPSAECARCISCAEAETYDAIRLFVERGKAVDDRFTLTDANAAIVADICRRLDGIPLAIELAAERIKIYSPQQLRERLVDRFRLLAGSRRDVPPRQQSLRALTDWSYDLLGTNERTLLQRLSTFANGFTLECAAAVGGDEKLAGPDVHDVLQLLVDKSLVQAESREAGLRFRIFESTRAYALERAPDLEERSAARSLCSR